MVEPHEGDLEATRQQSGLAPAPNVRLGAWELAWRLVPAHAAGGDLFDHYPIGDGRQAFSIARIAGRDGALPTSDYHRLLRAHFNGGSAISKAMGGLNEQVFRLAGKTKFVQLFYAEFDSLRGVLRYCNAGNCFPLLCHSDGRLVELGEGGLPLGVIESTDFAEAELSIEIGDSLMAFNDGICQALDPLGIGIGRDRVSGVWRRHSHAPPGEAVGAILAEVQSFRDLALKGEVDTFPRMADRSQDRAVDDMVPLRTEAIWLREHATWGDDLALVVLGAGA